MGDDPDGLIYIDWARAAPLHDAGLPGHVVAWGVNCNGQAAAWLVDTDALFGGDVDCEVVSPWHEQLGPLPKMVADRIWRRAPEDAVHMCAGFNRRGWPCGLPVTRPGERCRFHDKASAP
jgi:hypothetical protein